jgi:hypothetical protein
LRDADVGIREQGLGDLDLAVGEFRRLASSSARAPGGGKARWNAALTIGARLAVADA